MATVIQARPRQFVNTPAVERLAKRALRYLNSGFSIHLRGPAGTGKTTLALHLADLVGRPMMIIFGDHELKSSDLIGNKNGYTRRKVVDNFIHSVVKIEDELKQNWTDARLTLACKEGFTLVYDEFNRSRPEVNNVLLSALEEKLLILPPGEGQSEYIRVNPNFRAIFTSNPEEYCGVYGTQDALLDRLVTINMPEPDEQTQQAILLQKTKIDPESALRIVQIVKSFRETVKQSIPASAHYAESAKHSSPLRSCLMIAKVSQEHNLLVQENNQDFREVCADVLLSRTNLEWDKAQEILNRFLDARVPSVAQGKAPVKALVKAQKIPAENGLNQQEIVEENSSSDGLSIPPRDVVNQSEPLSAEPLVVEEPNYDENDHKLDGSESPTGLKNGQALLNGKSSSLNLAKSFTQMRSPQEKDRDGEAEVYHYLEKSEGMRVSQISKALGLNRFETIDALRSLMKKGLLIQRDDRLYVASQDNASQDKLS
jgi:gas vesicle protein GvpN